MFNNLKLAVKNFIGFGVVILITILAGMYLYSKMHYAEKSFDTMAEVYEPAEKLMHDIMEVSFNARLCFIAFAASGDIKDLQNGNKHLAEVSALIKKGESFKSIKEDLDLIYKEIQQYRVLIDKTEKLHNSAGEMRKKLDDAASIFDKECDNFFNLQKEFIVGAIYASMSPEQHETNIEIIYMGLNMVEDAEEMLMLINKAEARRSEGLFKEAINKFELVTKHILKLKKLLVSEESIKYLTEANKAAETYKIEMQNLYNSFIEAIDLDKKRLAAGETLIALIEKSGEKIQKQKLTSSTEAENSLSKASFISVISVIINAILASIIALIITLSIKRPIDKAIEIAKAVSLGDLSKRLNMNQTDEIGVFAKVFDQMSESLSEKAKCADDISKGDLTVNIKLLSEKDSLGKALYAMVEKLKGIIAEVKGAAENVASGSGQLSSTSQSISQGITEQASSLEEISASMNEIAAQTKQNAENAAKANKVAIEATSHAQKGNEQMTIMVTSMNEINESTKQVSKVIKAIDDIAFQTNLLALNAAIEAARAGKHGKGFAVVAQEVRNLATRSAQSAKESTELIEGASQKVIKGSEIANKTSEALRDIVTSIEKVTNLVADISVSSQEQAQGVEQVSKGINQIEQVTQQNTASVEEVASSAEELSSQAVQLSSAIDFFQIGEAVLKTVHEEINNNMPNKLLTIC